jgi:hypothetical protein
MQNKNWKYVVPKVNALEKQVATLTTQPAADAGGGKGAFDQMTTQLSTPAKEKPARKSTKKSAKPAVDTTQDDNPNIQMSNNSIIRNGNAIAESFSLFRKH